MSDYIDPLELYSGPMSEVRGTQRTCVNCEEPITPTGELVRHKFKFCDGMQTAQFFFCDMGCLVAYVGAELPKDIKEELQR